MGVIKYDKLVRDRIPEIIKNKGKNPIFGYLNKEEYIRKLNEKLHEEHSEYDDDESVEELADLVEVIYAILEYKNVSIEEFEQLRRKKVEERGAFKDRILLKEVIE